MMGKGEDIIGRFILIISSDYKRIRLGIEFFLDKLQPCRFNPSHVKKSCVPKPRFHILSHKIDLHVSPADWWRQVVESLRVRTLERRSHCEDSM